MKLFTDFHALIHGTFCHSSPDNPSVYLVPLVLYFNSPYKILNQPRICTEFGQFVMTLDLNPTVKSTRSSHISLYPNWWVKFVKSRRYLKSFRTTNHDLLPKKYHRSWNVTNKTTTPCRSQPCRDTFVPQPSSVAIFLLFSCSSTGGIYMVALKTSSKVAIPRPATIVSYHDNERRRVGYRGRLHK